MGSDSLYTGFGDSEGIQVWRIMNMRLVPVPMTEIGCFYDGDCYVALKTYGTPGRAWNIHFWIGKESSSDEITAAAYEAVSIDCHLGGKGVQFRETQGNESQQFLAYFRHGIRYLRGGVESGLRKTPDGSEKLLFHVKGAKNVALSVDSLNKGDVFILDCRDIIYVWNGPSSNNREKIKGAEMARDIRAEHGHKQKIEIIESDWDSHAGFYSNLGVPVGTSIMEAVKDEEVEDKQVKRTRLFRVSDATGKLEVKEVGPPFCHQDLDTNDCFFLDLGYEVFVWIGRKCTKQEREKVWTTVERYLDNAKLSNSGIRVTKINEGMETALFKAALNWPATTPFENKGIVGKGVMKSTRSESIQLPELHTAERSKYMPDDGKGQKKIWKVEKFSLVEVPKSDYGVFYSGDSYVIQYRSSLVRNGIIYFWLGWTSSLDEKSSAAILAMQIDQKEFSGSATQVRVVQSKEPAHFLSMFNGLIVTLTGGAASGFRTRKEQDTYDLDGTRLFQIRNQGAAQVEEFASSLNSNDVFVLETPKETFVWLGKGSSNREKITATECIQRLRLRTPATVFDEGHEYASFWAALGGKKQYATGQSLIDLEPNDVMILDTFDEIFVWVGEGANETEKKKSLDLALKYISSEMGGHRSIDDTGMYVVKQGYEPCNFTGHFSAWDPQYWTVNFNYERLKKQLTTDAAIVSFKEALSKYDRKYSVDVLRKSAELLPEGVNAVYKEKHLSDSDFARVFGMQRSQFDALPTWKQADHKKRVGLF